MLVLLRPLSSHSPRKSAFQPPAADQDLSILSFCPPCWYMANSSTRVRLNSLTSLDYSSLALAPTMLTRQSRLILFCDL